VDFIVAQGREAGGHLKQWGARTLVADCIQTDSLAGRGFPRNIAWWLQAWRHCDDGEWHDLRCDLERSIASAWREFALDFYVCV
jgi:hypothetical protein